MVVFCCPFWFRTRHVSRSTDWVIMAAENIYASVGNIYIVLRGHMPRHGSGTYSSESICPNGDQGHSPRRAYAPTGIGDIVLGEYMPQRGLGT